MTTLRFCVVVLYAAGLLAGESHRFLEVGRTPHGTFVWHGHVIPPPYVATFGYRADPDTVWSGVYINGLSLEPLREPRPANIGPSNRGFAVRMDSAMTQSIATARRRKDQDSSLVYGVALAEELRSHKDAVDSVTIDSGTQLLVYWKSISKPMGMTIGSLETSRGTPPGASPASRAPWASAEWVLRTLREDGLVVVSNGIRSDPSGRAGATWSEIDSLRTGLLPTGRRIDGTMRSELRYPEPLDSLRARQSGTP